MRHILVALDFSETSANLIRFSFAFNKHFFAHLHFIHVFQMPYVISPETEQILIPYDTMKKNYSDKLWALIEEHKGQYHFDISIHVTTGGEIQEISEYVIVHKIDMLIVGNKERSRWGRWVSGSITQQLLQKPPAHVLSITAGYDYKDWRNIWICTDLSTPLLDGQINFIKLMAAKLNAEIKILHISDVMERHLEFDIESQKKILDAFQKIPLHIPVKRNIPETIEEWIKKEGGDAIILFPHHHNWLDSIFLGHETTAISTEIDVPILAMKGEEN